MNGLNQQTRSGSQQHSPRNILLAVTGSISAYKTLDLTRELTKLGHHIRIILTRGALEFVNPNTYKFLGAEEVYLPEDDFRGHQQGKQLGNVLHVELGKWASLFAIVPLSANSLSRLIRGEANDLMTSTFLAYGPTKPILVFPAMNPQMLSHPFVESNFEDLKKLSTVKNISLFGTQQGILACGDHGEGKLLSIEDITTLLSSFPLTKNHNAQKILISSGASITPIDPVRFLTNSSSGLTGYYLARSFIEHGHQVSMAMGLQGTLKNQAFLHLANNLYHEYRATTVEDFYHYLSQNIEASDVYIGSAALSDWHFEMSQEKIKKHLLKNHSLEFTLARDVLKSLLEIKKEKQLTTKFVGFAAETQLTKEKLLEKYGKKPTDLLIGTEVHNGLSITRNDGHSHVEKRPSKAGFDQLLAHYLVLKNEQIIFQGQLHKEDLGVHILQWLKSYE